MPTWNILIALALLSSFVPPAHSEDSTDLSALLETIAQFYEAVRAGDSEARIDLLAEDVIMMPNHWTSTRGKEGVAKMIRSSADAVFQIKDHEVLYLEIDGDLAYTVNSYAYTYHPKEQPEQWHKTKNVHIWRRDPGGDWRLAVDIWNSDVPIQQFAEE